MQLCQRERQELLEKRANVQALCMKLAKLAAIVSLGVFLGTLLTVGLLE